MRTFLLLGVLGCGTEESPTGPSDTASPPDPTGSLDLAISLCDPAANGPFSPDVDNPYLPFVVGEVHVLEGLEGGIDFSRFSLEALDETEEVGGVEARVVEKTDLYGGTATTATAAEREFYAQAGDGTVCLFGGDDDGDGVPDWEAGVDGALAGIFMPAEPVVGMRYPQVHEADGEEIAEITYVGVETVTPAATFPDTVTVLEEGPSIKKYARGVGEIYDDGIELVSY